VPIDSRQRSCAPPRRHTWTRRGNDRTMSSSRRLLLSFRPLSAAAGALRNWDAVMLRRPHISVGRVAGRDDAWQHAGVRRRPPPVRGEWQASRS
jgi:hypothetical protein